MAEPLNATFFAFRKREKAGVLLRLSVAFALMAVALCVGFAVLFWSGLSELIGWYGQVIQASASNDTEALAQIGMPTGMFAVLPGMLLWMLLFYILCAAYEAGALRWMIHGESVGLMGLSLGAPTWRVYATYWIWFLLYMALSIVMSILLMTLMGVLAVSSGDPTSTLIALPVYYILQYGLMIYFGVRFAPAAAASIARRKFAFFDAWTVTKGRFWALLGSFLLLWLMYFAASIVLGIAWFATMLSGASIDWTAMSDPARANEAVSGMLQNYLQSLMQPQSWAIAGALWFVGLIVAVLFYLGSYGINARAAQAGLEEGKIQAAS
ncbi:MAG: hypothetical protein JNJ63_04355 [Hyphomonadaceae bacterium]|nr:hypothetical protein [Hyphomonadaceae bacterium]